MATALGFLNINSFFDNSENAVNSVGELSSFGRTFSRDVEEFHSTLCSLIIFDRSGFTNLQDPAWLQTFGQQLVDEMSGLPGAVDAPNLLPQVQGIIGGSFNATAVGNSILHVEDGRQYPEWIEMHLDDGLEGVDVKIWLVDTTFQAEYPLCEITVISPIANAQDYMNDFASAKAETLNVTTSQLMAKGNAEMGNDVFTGTDIVTLRVYDAADSNNWVDSEWLVYYNGGVACNHTAFLTAIGEFLENGGAFSLNDWGEIMPSLIPLNRFFCVPRWAKTAVDNPSLSAPLYSPTLLPGDEAAVAGLYFSTYAEADVLLRMEHAIALHKSLAFWVMPSEENPDGWIKFSEKFPDYMAIAVNDPAINQLNAVTRAAMLDLQLLVQAAEVYTPGDTLPGDVTEVTYDGYRYLQKQTLSVAVLVATRESVTA